MELFVDTPAVASRPPWGQTNKKKCCLHWKQPLLQATPEG